MVTRSFLWSGPLKGGFDDPGDAFAGVNLLGNLALVGRAHLLRAPFTAILAFGVLPEDYEVDGVAPLSTGTASDGEAALVEN